MTPFMCSLTAGKALLIIGVSSIRETSSRLDGVQLRDIRFNLQESRFVALAAGSLR